MSGTPARRRPPLEGGAVSFFQLPKSENRARYARAAARILPGWELSLAFVGPKKARALNRSLRGKSYVPNVLAYRVGERHGEIIICPSIAKKQASDFLLPASCFLLLLFIHGALHLAGYRHGATMERTERALLAESLGFVTTTHVTKNRNRP